MPPTSQAALVRKREYGRAWHRTHEREQPRHPAIEAEDEHWIVLICDRCCGLFDIPRQRRGRLPRTCGCS